MTAAGNDYVLLTPKVILIKASMDIATTYSQLSGRPNSIPDEQLRAQVNEYTTACRGRQEEKFEKAATPSSSSRKLDYYIRHKEETGDDLRSATQGPDSSSFIRSVRWSIRSWSVQILSRGG